MLDKNNFQKSLAILVKTINDLNADGLIINSTQNRFWLLNLEASDGYVTVDRHGKVTLIIDGRYYYHAHSVLGELIEVKLLNADYSLSNFLQAVQWQKVLIEDLYSTATFYLSLTKLVREVAVFSAQGVREIKNQSEIANLKKAGEIAALTVDFIKQFATPGKTEREVALAATIKMLELGGAKNSFDPIVASGPNGANAHHRPTDRVLLANEMITLDLGCVYNNFCSDTTRTWAVANTPLPADLQAAHQAVLTAQALGIKTAKAGNSTFLVDKACRDHLKKLNLDQYFIHSTGHGLGIDVHELPGVHSYESRSTKLVNGMVITVEPGVYIDKKYGVRIEDSLVIDGDDPIILNDLSDRGSNW